MHLDVVSKVVVEAASDDPRELRTAAELRGLLVANDLSGLQWTSRVVVQHQVVPHSHPVLVLNTRSQGDRLLATYVHEQLHWWTVDHPGFSDAITDTERIWATTPTTDGGGAATEFRTRLHLIVCHLEQRAVQHIVGDARSRVVLREQITTGRVYPWIYDQITIRQDRLDQICSARDLWPDRLKPAH